ncbi:ubiquitin carboxyl-terminal hydrolase domain-containing protein [Cyclospora cayetanensis]|uniref:ubiquitinyl hydrolase 1 n=1 Tax=Cyclospora cayetanensis TaxID=88456 RepID=A0A1D3DAL6_9EIME|nr:ubiquitin carboxyl-terminal hydrolase domain-containing protein [Cyclospora cayetanensis]
MAPLGSTCLCSCRGPQPPPGLLNLGRTCSFNVLLQALAATRTFSTLYAPSLEGQQGSWGSSDCCSIGTFVSTGGLERRDKGKALLVHGVPPTAWGSNGFCAPKGRIKAVDAVNPQDTEPFAAAAAEQPASSGRPRGRRRGCWGAPSGPPNSIQRSRGSWVPPVSCSRRLPQEAPLKRMRRDPVHRILNPIAFVQQMRLVNPDFKEDRELDVEEIWRFLIEQIFAELQTPKSSAIVKGGERRSPLRGLQDEGGPQGASAVSLSSIRRGRPLETATNLLPSGCLVTTCRSPSRGSGGRKSQSWRVAEGPPSKKRDITSPDVATAGRCYSHLGILDGKEGALTPSLQWEGEEVRGLGATDEAPVFALSPECSSAFCGVLPLRMPERSRFMGSRCSLSSKLQPITLAECLHLTLTHGCEAAEPSKRASREGEADESIEYLMEAPKIPSSAGKRDLSRGGERSERVAEPCDADAGLSRRHRAPRVVLTRLATRSLLVPYLGGGAAAPVARGSCSSVGDMIEASSQQAAGCTPSGWLCDSGGDPPSALGRYALRAVIEHQGRSGDGGHYVCYRRGWEPFEGPSEEEDVWWVVNDVCVRRSCWEEVRKTQAYLLLYELESDRVQHQKQRRPQPVGGSKGKARGARVLEKRQRSAGGTP